MFWSGPTKGEIALQDRGSTACPLVDSRRSAQRNSERSINEFVWGWFCRKCKQSHVEYFPRIGRNISLGRLQPRGYSPLWIPASISGYMFEWESIQPKWTDQASLTLVFIDEFADWESLRSGVSDVSSSSETCKTPKHMKMQSCKTWAENVREHEVHSRYFRLKAEGGAAAVLSAPVAGRGLHLSHFPNADFRAPL